MIIEAEVLRTIAGLHEFAVRDVAAHCSVDTGVIRQVVERHGELFARSADPIPPAQQTRWTVADAGLLRQALQALPVRDRPAERLDRDTAADQLRRAEFRLTGAARLLETLDLLDDDTRARTRSLVIALLQESAGLTLQLAEDLGADEPATHREDAGGPTLTVDLRDPREPTTGRHAHRARLADEGPTTLAQPSVMPAPVERPGAPTGAGEVAPKTRGTLARLLTGGRNRSAPPPRHAR